VVLAGFQGGSNLRIDLVKDLVGAAASQSWVAKPPHDAAVVGSRHCVQIERQHENQPGCSQMEEAKPERRFAREC
jgi:hypothetical protein